MESAASPARSETQVPVPIVVVSQCLGFAPVRYNGQVLQDAFVQALAQHVHFIQVCPEVGIGLGVPRDPIRIVDGPEGRRLIQPSTGRDLTGAMEHFRTDFLRKVGPVDGFILKSRSPSCGIKDVKVFPPAPDSPSLGKSSGLFADAVLRQFPGAAIEDEGRLTNLRLRHHFLVRLYTAARFRQVCAAGTMADLVRFQTEYKLQLMAFSQTGLRELGRIVARTDSAPFATVLDRYQAGLARILAEPARSSSNRNVLLHAFGYVSARLTADERRYFLDMLEEYRRERLPLSALVTLLKGWVVRFQESYLLGQRFFEPYPRALLDLGDSASGKAPI